MIATLQMKESSGTIETSGLGEFSGYAAVYGNLDRNGEILDRGACAKSIAVAGGEFPLLWQHERTQPIGVAQLEDSDRGVRVKAVITRGTPLGDQAYALLQPPPGFRRGALRDLSIGYMVHKDGVIDGVRHLKEIELFEVSLVTVAANPRTFVTRVKDTALGGAEYADAESAEIADILAEIRADCARMRERARDADEDEAKELLEEIRSWRSSRSGDDNSELASLLGEMRSYTARLERQHAARRCYA